jgi:hypothetical protein
MIKLNGQWHEDRAATDKTVPCKYVVKRGVPCPRMAYEDNIYGWCDKHEKLYHNALDDAAHDLELSDPDFWGSDDD